MLKANFDKLLIKPEIYSLVLLRRHSQYHEHIDWNINLQQVVCNNWLWSLILEIYGQDLLMYLVTYLYVLVINKELYNKNKKHWIHLSGYLKPWFPVKTSIACLDNDVTYLPGHYACPCISGFLKKMQVYQFSFFPTPRISNQLYFSCHKTLM